MPSANDSAERLVAAALERGAPDNVTVIVVHMSKTLRVERSESADGRASFLGSLRDRFAGRGVLHAPQVVEDDDAADDA